MKQMGILRLESFKSNSVRKLRCTYKKMWVGAFYLFIFSGDVTTCLRSLSEERTNISVHEADQAPVTTSLLHNSSKLHSRTNKKLERLGMQFDSKFSAELRCERQDLSITTNHKGKYLPNGMPTFSVQITNTCIDCCLTDIHVACGEWASGTLVNPKLFRRVMEDDCLVKDGNALEPQEIFFFEYANSFEYPLSCKSVTPVCP